MGPMGTCIWIKPNVRAPKNGNTIAGIGKAKSKLSALVIQKILLTR